MKQAVSAVIVAAGSSTRMGFDKLSAMIGGETVLEKSMRVFENCDEVEELVFVYGKNEGFVRSVASKCAKRVCCVQGGETRAQSAANGVCAATGTLVAIHDAARPFVSQTLLSQVLAAARIHGAAAPAVPVKDTIKQVEILGDGEAVPKSMVVAATPDRNTLFAVQTPQCFCREAYIMALNKTTAQTLATLTDDCSLFEARGWRVHLTEGDYANYKITTREDLPVAKKSVSMRVGHGYDVHKLVEGRKLILGGVEIPYEKGLLGHSDADVLAHAIMDALLGAAGQGDIGKHFPDTDAAYSGADSLVLAREVANVLAQHGYEIGNIDATILCEKPKLAPHIPSMCARIAQALGIDETQINVKATTEEKLGFTGEGLGIAAHAVAFIG